MFRIKNHKNLAIITLMIFLVTVFLPLFPLPASGSPVYIGPGVTFESRSTQLNGKNQVLQILDIDTTNPFLQFRASAPKDRIQALESVSGQAKRQSQPGSWVIGAINGDFHNISGSYTGVPSGLSVKDGELLAAPGYDAVFGITGDGQPFIDTVTMQGAVTVQGSGETHRINAVNKGRSDNSLVVYTPSFGATTRTNVYGTEVVLTGLENLPLRPDTTYTGTVTEVRLGSGNSGIPRDGVVLSGHGTAALFLNKLYPGAQVSFSIALSKTGIRQAVGGSPRIVIDGQVAPPAELKKARHAFERHPRTAVGLKGNRLFWVTVDGRQPGYSEGVTLEELGRLMVSLGAEQALNLDGGGSTAMVIRAPGDFTPSLANRPSSGFERAVSNSLQVISTAPAGILSYVFITPGEVAPLTYGSQQLFRVKGLDEYYNPVDLTGRVTWSVSGSIGPIDQTGLFTAGQPGQGEVIVTTIEGLSARVPVSVKELVYEPSLPSFADVTADGPFGWAKKEIEELAAREIIKGKGENLFAPQDDITRAEFTALLVRALKIPKPAQPKPGFKDIPSKDWYAADIQAAVEKGLIQGFEDKTFRPHQQISRAEMGVILARAMKAANPKGVIPVSSTNPLPKFVDYQTIPNWARTDLKVAVEQGLLQGIVNQQGAYLAPLDKGNRAQAAVLVKRFYDKAFRPVQTLASH